MWNPDGLFETSRFWVNSLYTKSWHNSRTKTDVEMTAYIPPPTDSFNTLAK